MEGEGHSEREGLVDPAQEAEHEDEVGESLGQAPFPVEGEEADAAPGAGWEPLLRYGQTTIQDKILYGSGAFLLGQRPADLLAEMRALPLKPDVLQSWLWGNAARLFHLEE